MNYTVLTYTRPTGIWSMAKVSNDLQMMRKLELYLVTFHLLSPPRQ